MSIESLKQQARRHEQDEAWQKALDQYQKALKELAKEEQTDIGLVNRVGDLFVRIGKLDEAVRYYEQAVDLYREAFLPNNAIAVCKKIIRSVPTRHQAYLKIGQIRAEQGFLPDARTHFLTYAERMQQAGDLDESFRALVEFCDLAPDDVGVRITVADQMAASHRTDDAVEQLLVAYRQLTQSGESDLAQGVEKKLLALDPDVDLGAALAAADDGGLGMDGEIESQFGEIDIGGSVDAEPFDESGELARAAERFVVEASEGLGATEEEEAELVGGADSAEELDDDVEGAFELPMMSFGDDSGNETEDDEVELPMIPLDDSEEDFDDSPLGAEVDLPVFDIAGGEEVGAAETVAEVDEAREEETPSGLDYAFEEPAVAREEAYEESSTGRFDAPPEPDATPPAPPPAAPPERAAPAQQGQKEPDTVPEGGYVDLGAMVLGGGDRKSTRMRVAYEEPSGDEEADFVKMLTQFKEKVSENIDSRDVRAHYDLGTAYKEMGLLEEAISAFQAALRASSEHLPTYELMGQTFIEMGQPEAAVRTLQRALRVQGGVEDEFVGIYYYLGRAFEVLEQRESAVDYYDRVFSLDINFADVTERLRELR